MRLFSNPLRPSPLPPIPHVKQLLGPLLIPHTPVGYGDVPLTTPEVRLFACFHILVSVSWLAALMSSVSDLSDKRSSQLAPVETVTVTVSTRALVTAYAARSERSDYGSGCLVSGIPTQRF